MKTFKISNKNSNHFNPITSLYENEELIFGFYDYDGNKIYGVWNKHTMKYVYVSHFEIEEYHEELYDGNDSF